MSTSETPLRAWTRNPLRQAGRGVSRTVVAAAWFASLMVGACRGREPPDAAAGTPRSPAATDTARAGTAGPADTGRANAAPEGELTDADIVALLDEANKATAADMKAFARLMMSEHHALRVLGQRLAKQLGVTPQPPAGDPMAAAAKAEMDALRSAPKGAEFDRTYVDQEVAIHKAVIDLAEKAHGATQNEQLKDLIEKAKPFLEKHLDQAEELQKKPGKPAA